MRNKLIIYAIVILFVTACSETKQEVPHKLGTELNIYDKVMEMDTFKLTRQEFVDLLDEFYVRHRDSELSDLTYKEQEIRIKNTLCNYRGLRKPIIVSSKTETKNFNACNFNENYLDSLIILHKGNISVYNAITFNDLGVTLGKHCFSIEELIKHNLIDTYGRFYAEDFQITDFNFSLTDYLKAFENDSINSCETYYFIQDSGSVFTRYMGQRFWEIKVKEKKGILLFNGRKHSFHLAVDLKKENNTIEVKFDSIISLSYYYLGPEEIQNLKKGEFLFNLEQNDSSLKTKSPFLRITERDSIDTEWFIFNKKEPKEFYLR